MSGSLESKPIWDLPTRTFHWLLVIGVVLQFGTGKFGWLSMQWHFWSGYALLTLLLFRIFWGFFGSESARFFGLLVGPRRVFNYLRQWSSTPMSRFAGHNPAGAWATLLILLALLTQSLSGLFSSDEMEWFGPLSSWVPDRTAAFATWVHHSGEPVILALIALHVLAVALYWFVKRENLVAGMWHGLRPIEVSAPFLTGNRRALLLLAVAAALVAGTIAWAE